MQFRTIYTHDRAISALYATQNEEESLTQQSDKDDCDINIIMERYGKTGQVPQLLDKGMPGDFTAVTDYRTALDALKAADDTFAQVPAKIRAEFKNDPAEFIRFVENPANQEKIYEMGLAERPKPPNNPVVPVPVTPAP